MVIQKENLKNLVSEEIVDDTAIYLLYIPWTKCWEMRTADRMRIFQRTHKDEGVDIPFVQLGVGENVPEFETAYFSSKKEKV